MRAYRRRLCHPLFNDAHTPEDVVRVVVGVLEVFAEKRELPDGASMTDQGKGTVTWVVSEDAPPKVGDWISMSPKDVGAPTNCLWIGFNKQVGKYAIVEVGTAPTGQQGISLSYRHTLDGFCYKSIEVN